MVLCDVQTISFRDHHILISLLPFIQNHAGGLQFVLVEDTLDSSEVRALD